MSRIGNNPILIPNGVEILIDGDKVVAKGPKGELSTAIPSVITVEKKEGTVIVKRKKEDKAGKSLHGLVRSLIANTVVGVSEGWTKNLEMVGVGYRAQGGGNQITLNVGYSHPVKMDAPEGITFGVLENTKLSVAGIDKILVGQVAANLRAVRSPEVYKGKGIRYAGEYVRKKAGKAGKAAGAAK